MTDRIYDIVYGATAGGAGVITAGLAGYEPTWAALLMFAGIFVAAFTWHEKHGAQ